MVKCACGWINSWRDSGDRGAAQHQHDRSECPVRSTCNAIRWDDNTPNYCTAAPHTGNHSF